MWLAAIMFLLTFLVSKKKGASTGEALAYGALAGGATYYVATETDWGQENLLPINNSIDEFVTGTPQVDSEGNAVVGTGGKPNGNTSVGTWLPIAGAAVGGAVAGSSDSFPWLLVGGVALAAFVLGS